MFEKVSHADLILAMFEKVRHGDNLFSVSYRQKLWKSFLVPDFTTVMSLAWVWYADRKRISKRINLYIAHLLHFYESVNNKFSNILKTRFSFFLIMEFCLNWEESPITAAKNAGKWLVVLFGLKSINSLTFQQVPLLVLKIVWGVSSWSCVMVATLTFFYIYIYIFIFKEKM